ncbi:hypothetical protein [Sporosarcina highlanderae]|uniref:Uncharacterized protein n=1 Tax=Sporosarcina highlanderae TaxID=3035916 RepID=A0ABT8JQP2_9BACL|nr:hypothetical protein [Sporosarcina highlanderae]MDN4606509.1 hypothetical protein [Sporosarcina highlanderae]
MILSGRNSCTPYSGQHRIIARKERIINELQKHMVPGIGTGDNPQVALFRDVRNAYARFGEYNVYGVRNRVASMECNNGKPVVCVFSDTIFHNKSRGLTYGKRSVTDVFRTSLMQSGHMLKEALKATAAARGLKPLLDIEGRQD